jgi:hypothetical protein
MHSLGQRLGWACLSDMSALKARAFLQINSCTHWTLPSSSGVHCEAAVLNTILGARTAAVNEVKIPALTEFTFQWRQKKKSGSRCGKCDGETWSREGENNMLGGNYK